jgi:ABC-2 type transport system permease protein
MNNFWRVAVYEYKRNVFKKSFLFTLLSVPFFIALSIGLGLVIESSRKETRPVGYVDHAGVFTEAALTPEIRALRAAEYDDPIEFVAYPTEAEALAALEAGDIQAYYLLQADYLDTRRVEQKYIELPRENAEYQFFDFLQLNLAAGQTPEIAARLAAGTEVIVRSLDGSRFLPNSGPTFSLMMPLFIALAFLAMLLMSSNYALAALVDEKENRTLEILVTAISPFQLIGGKILSVVAISLTLLATWALVVLIGIFVAARMGVAWFSNLEMDWRSVLATLAVALPAYVLAIALMTAIGSVVSTEQESQPVGVVFFLLHLLPFYVIVAFMNQPHSPLAVILSLLPFTALTTIGARNLFTIIPTWQVAVSVAVQGLCALGALWLASRAFRLGMLRYGQRLVWGKLFKAKD